MVGEVLRDAQARIKRSDSFIALKYGALQACITTADIVYSPEDSMVMMNFGTIEVVSMIKNADSFIDGEGDCHVKVKLWQSPDLELVIPA